MMKYLKLFESLNNIFFHGTKVKLPFKNLMRILTEPV